MSCSDIVYKAPSFPMVLHSHTSSLNNSVMVLIYETTILDLEIIEFTQSSSEYSF